MSSLNGATCTHSNILYALLGLLSYTFVAILLDNMIHKVEGTETLTNPTLLKQKTAWILKIF